MRSIGVSLFFCAVACSGNLPDEPATGGGNLENSGLGGDSAGVSYGGASCGATGGNVGEPAGSTSYGGDSANPNGGAFPGGSAGAGPVGNGGASLGITSCNGDFPFLGVWEGSVLDYFFEPVEDVRMELSQGGAGGISGSIRFGREAPPPPATDARAPYPPGYNTPRISTGGEATAGAGGRGPNEPWPGFSYTIERGAACDDSLRIAISGAEIWDSWCALQVPVYTDGYGWNAMLVGGTYSYSAEGCEVTAANGESASYSPAQCVLSNYCSCDEQSCSHSPNWGPSFDFSRVGDGDVLSAPNYPDGQHTIRLERVE